MVALLQSLGWVEQAACRPYTPSAADSALVSVMPEVAAGGYSPGEDSASHAVCARALKLAAQYQNVDDIQQVRFSRTVLVFFGRQRDDNLGLTATVCVFVLNWPSSISMSTTTSNR